MTDQLTASIAAESLLYSFTPSIGRGGGGGPAPTSSSIPPPVNSSRRPRTQSVPGDSTYQKDESDEFKSPCVPATSSSSVGPGTGLTSTATSASLGNNIPSSTLNTLSPSTNPGNSGGIAFSRSPSGTLSSPLGSSSLSALGMPNRATVNMNRCGSADRHQHLHGASNLTSISSLNSLTTGSGGGSAVSSAMPVINGGVCVERVLPPMRHSMSGNAGLGLPKLDLPNLAFSGGSGGGGTATAGPLDLPGLAPSSSGRRSVSGGIGESGLNPTSSLLDLATTAAPFDTSTPPSPSRNAVLAPLRVSGAFTAANGGVAIGISSALSAVGASAVVESAGGGWCGATSGVGGGLFASSGSRRYTSPSGSPADSGSFPPTSPGILMPSSSECPVVALPLTPNQATSNLCAPPRRSNSLTAKGPAASIAAIGGPGRLANDGTGCFADGGMESEVAVPPLPIKECSTDITCLSSSSTAVSSTAAKVMHEVTNDLQRAAGALLALNPPVTRPKSASALTSTPTSTSSLLPPAPPPPPVQLTRAQLTVLKNASPELQWELRVAVRRIFQVLRQELSAAPVGRQFGSAVHDCWATLDAYFEGTSDLIDVLVNRVMEAAAAAPSSPPQPPPRAPSPSPRQRLLATGTDGGSEGGAAAAAASNVENERDVNRLRAVNEELQRQLEDCKARLLKFAALQAPEAEASAAANGARAGGDVRGVGGTGAGAAPRPPPATAMAPPALERCYGASPRRGKHAMIQSSSREEAAAAVSDGGSCHTGASGGLGGGAGVASAAAAAAGDATPAPGSNASSSGRNVAESPQRRIDRAAMSRSASYDEMVIEEEDSDAGFTAAADSIDDRRKMLTYHSASFAEWVRGARRR